MISKKLYNSLKVYIIILIAFNLIFISMGQINRWDLLEQVSMADNYIKNGFFIQILRAKNFLEQVFTIPEYHFYHFFL